MVAHQPHHQLVRRRLDHRLVKRGAALGNCVRVAGLDHPLRLGQRMVQRLHRPAAPDLARRVPGRPHLQGQPGVEQVVDRLRVPAGDHRPAPRIGMHETVALQQRHRLAQRHPRHMQFLPDALLGKPAALRILPEDDPLADRGVDALGQRQPRFGWASEATVDSGFPPNHLSACKFTRAHPAIPSSEKFNSLAPMF